MLKLFSFEDMGIFCCRQIDSLSSSCKYQGQQYPKGGRLKKIKLMTEGELVITIIKIHTGVL